MASVFAVFDGLKEVEKGEFRKFKADVEHVKHGFCNVVAGLIQSIPVVQTFANWKYFRTEYKFSDDQKLVPYTSDINMENDCIDPKDMDNTVSYYMCYKTECELTNQKPVSYFDFVLGVYPAIPDTKDDFLDY
jgi:hypothetical protein